MLGEPGYVFLQWSDWQVETSLILIVAAIFLAIIVLYVVFGIITGIFGIPGRIGAIISRIQGCKTTDQNRTGVRVPSIGRLEQGGKNSGQYGKTPA